MDLNVYFTLCIRNLYPLIFFYLKCIMVWCESQFRKETNNSVFRCKSDYEVERDGVLLLSLHFHRNAGVSHYKKQKTLINSLCFTDDVCCGVFLFVWNFVRARNESWTSCAIFFGRFHSICRSALYFRVFNTLWPILEQPELLQVLLSVRSERYFNIIKIIRNF